MFDPRDGSVDPSGVKVEQRAVVSNHELLDVVATSEIGGRLDNHGVGAGFDQDDFGVGSHRGDADSARRERFEHEERLVSAGVDEVVGEKEQHLSDFVRVDHRGELGDVLAAETERHDGESVDPLTGELVDGRDQIERGEITLANQVQGFIVARQLAELFSRAFDAEHLPWCSAGCAAHESQILVGIRPRAFREAVRQQRVFAAYARRRLEHQQ